MSNVFFWQRHRVCADALGDITKTGLLSAGMQRGSIDLPCLQASLGLSCKGSHFLITCEACITVSWEIILYYTCTLTH